MKRLLLELEHRSEPVIPPRQFIIRLGYSGIIALALIAMSLSIGMVGYHILEGLSWIDAFLNASMLLGGMGPVHTPVTFDGKLFAGLLRPGRDPSHWRHSHAGRTSHPPQVPHGEPQ